MSKKKKKKNFFLVKKKLVFKTSSKKKKLFLSLVANSLFDCYNIKRNYTKGQSTIDFLRSPQQCKQKVESYSTHIFVHENTFYVFLLQCIEWLFRVCLAPQSWTGLNTEVKIIITDTFAPVDL
jgi:hypothetical protein